MPIHRAATSRQGGPVLVDIAYRTRASSARLLPLAVAHARFGPALDRLRRMVEPAVAMTFSRAWWEAVPPPQGYAHRLLVLERYGELCAAMYLRERMVMGLPTGILHGSDAKGDSLVLCPPGTEAGWLAEGIRLLFGSGRCTALLLTRPVRWGGYNPALRLYDMDRGRDDTGAIRWVLERSGLEQRSQAVESHWRTLLRPTLDRTLAAFGHRTRRNLRHALRRVHQNGWQFVPEMSPAQVAEAADWLASRSTHPYTEAAIAARLEVERSQERSFSMGLRKANGDWLSLLSGVRRRRGVTDIFWQSNAAAGHDSVAFSMRALLMGHEGWRGASMLRWIGGTSPLMEHCCLPDAGTQMLITRPGLRVALLKRLGTRLASAGKSNTKAPAAGAVRSLRKRNVWGGPRTLLGLMIRFQQGTSFRQRQQSTIDLELILAGVMRHLVDVRHGVATCPQLFHDKIRVDHPFHPPGRVLSATRRPAVCAWSSFPDAVANGCRRFHRGKTARSALKRTTPSGKLL